MNGPKPAPSQTFPKTRLEMIEAGGRLSQLLGLPRSTGQIYGLLYLSSRPLSLDEIADTLGISKASVSVGARQLCAWTAIRQVWVHGERRDHYEAEPELVHLLRAGYQELIQPRINSSKRRLDRLSSLLEEDFESGVIDAVEKKFLSQRLKNFARLQKKVQTLVPLAERLL